MDLLSERMKDYSGVQVKRLPEMKDGIWIIDAEARTVYANARMAEILGASKDELIGEHSFNYVFPDDEPAARRLFNFKRGGDAAPFRFKLRRKDGTGVWVDVQGTPMFNAADQFKGIVGTFTLADSNDRPPSA